MGSRPAANDYWGNDSIHIQFSDSIEAAGDPVFRTGTTESTVVNLEDCSGCGLRDWGWKDNGWGISAPGPVIVFASTGTKTLRMQNREDRLAVDQGVLSPAAYLQPAPRALQDDVTILSERDGSNGSRPAEPSACHRAPPAGLHSAARARLGATPHDRRQTCVRRCSDVHRQRDRNTTCPGTLAKSLVVLVESSPSCRR